MAIVFLIGGTGNQLFQFANSDTGDRFSTLFLSKPVRRVFGWTQHEQFFSFEVPSLPMHVLALIAMALDFGLAFITGRSLFTEFDLRGIKAQARVRRLVYMGYAQAAPGSRDLGPIIKQVGTRPDLGPGSVVLHIRGGDLVKLDAQGENTYGMLGVDYYQAALTWSQTELEKKGLQIKRVTIITDDPEHASGITADLPFDFDWDIAHIPLMETFQTALSAEYFLSSNSTMSYWIILMRKGVKTAVPDPFMKRGDMSIPKVARHLTCQFFLMV